MTLDHIGFAVADFARSREFFTQALAPLGISVIMEGPGFAGLGRDGKPQFWFAGRGNPAPGTHIAFVAENRAQVRAFYDAALKAGGRDNGAPGIRAHYHPNYYGAFVLDPDGHNVEAVCHLPESQ
jgi:catechol 2,3-dioxygenase-like lactoylglutathione lyase family enzyme